MITLGQAEERMARLDAAFAPVLKEPFRPATIEEFNAFMEAGPPTFPPEQEAEASEIVQDLVIHYAEGDDATRHRVRGLLHRYSSFRWVAQLPWEPTADSFRMKVLLLSARNFSDDPRDEAVTLTDLCRRAEAAGIEIHPILREVAALSSDDDPYGWGSMKSRLNQAGGG